MSKSSFTYENMAKMMKSMSLTNIPSNLKDVTTLVIYGMINNYDEKYSDNIINMLSYTSMVVTDNSRDIYIKNVKNIVSNNKINIFLDSNHHYAIYIDKSLKGLGLLENLVKAFNEVFTYSLNESSLKKVFASLQSESIIKYIINSKVDNKFLDTISNINVDRYTCNSNIGENLFKKVYAKDSTKYIIDDAIINNNIDIIKNEIDNVLGFGMFDIISKLYENIINYNLNNTYLLSKNYVKLRYFINEYLVRKYGIV